MRTGMSIGIWALDKNVLKDLRKILMIPIAYLIK